MKARLETTGMNSLMVRLFDTIEEDNMPWILAADSALRKTFGAALTELVPSYTTLLVEYDCASMTLADARVCVMDALEALQPAPSDAGQQHTIDVWYDESVGPELPRLAERAGLSVDEVIERHCGHDYRVFALGFTPGYGFMGLVDETLATPRLKTPRRKVAAGSVAIADRQTAVYPLLSPGGWNIVGRSTVTLFDRNREGYSLLHPGDRVRFRAITREQFEAQGGDTTPLAER